MLNYYYYHRWRGQSVSPTKVNAVRCCCCLVSVSVCCYTTAVAIIIIIIIIVVIIIIFASTHWQQISRNKRRVFGRRTHWINKQRTTCNDAIRKRKGFQFRWICLNVYYISISSLCVYVPQTHFVFESYYVWSRHRAHVHCTFLRDNDYGVCVCLCWVFLSYSSVSLE